MLGTVGGETDTPLKLSLAPLRCMDYADHPPGRGPASCDRIAGGRWTPLHGRRRFAVSHEVSGCPALRQQAGLRNVFTYPPVSCNSASFRDFDSGRGVSVTYMEPSKHCSK